MKTTDLVYEAIKPMFDGLDIQLVEVEYIKKVDGMHLIVYIDAPNGVTINDCSYVSKLIDPVLEELNPTNDASYSLDVSSYGLDKPLKHDWQFEKYLNQKVTVKLYKKVDNLKEFDAILKDYNTEFKFEVNNQEIILSKDLVAHITPYIEF